MPLWRFGAWCNTINTTKTNTAVQRKNVQVAWQLFHHSRCTATLQPNCAALVLAGLPLQTAGQLQQSSTGRGWCAPSFRNTTRLSHPPQASARLFYLVNTVVEAQAVIGSDPDGAGHEQRAWEAVHHSPVVAACMAALADDLNTPAALAALSQTLRELNDALYTRKGRKAAGRVERLASQVAAVQHVLGVVGVAASHEVLQDLRRTALVRCVVGTIVCPIDTRTAGGG